MKIMKNTPEIKVQFKIKIRNKQFNVFILNWVEFL